MSKGRFQTPSSFREELLRQSLLSEAYDAKRYYQDGFYKPETEQMVLAKAQGQFYNRIDQLGYQISSELYRENSAEGKFLRDTVNRASRKITEDLENSVRQGLMTPQTYDDLVGYLSEVVRSAQTGEFTKRRSSAVATEMEQPTDLIQRLVSLNLTGMSNQQIAKILKELGATQADVRRILALMEQRMAQAAAPAVVIPNPGGDNGNNPGDDQQPQTEDQRANIAHPSVFIRDGELPDQTQAIYNILDRAGNREQVLAGGASATESQRARTDFEIQRRLLAAEEGMTNRYGLDPREYETLMRDTNEAISQGIRNNVSPAVLRDIFRRIANEVPNPNFDYNQYINLFSDEYSRQYEQGMNEIAGTAGAAASSGGRQGQNIADLIREQEALESGLNDRAPLPHNSAQAQDDAARNMLPTHDKIAQIINTQHSEFAEAFLKNINDGQLPVSHIEGEESITEYDNEVIDQLRALTVLQQELEKVKKGEAATITPSALFEIRAIVPPALYDQLMARLESTSIDEYNEFQEETQDLDPDESDDDAQIQTIVDRMREIRRATARSLRAAQTAVHQAAQENPLAWRLKTELNGTTADPERVAEGFVLQLQGNPSLHSNERSRTVSTSVADVNKLISQQFANVFEHKTASPRVALATLQRIRVDLRANPQNYGLNSYEARVAENEVESASQALAERAVREGLLEQQIAEGKKGRGRPKKGGTRYDSQEFYKVGAPARTAQNKDPPMRFVVGEGRRQNTKGDHSIIIK